MSEARLVRKGRRALRKSRVSTEEAIEYEWAWIKCIATGICVERRYEIVHVIPGGDP